MPSPIIFFCNLVRLLFAPVRYAVLWLRRRSRAAYVRICLPRRVTDLAAPPGSPWQALLWRAQHRHATDLRQLQKLFDQIAADPQRQGVILQVGKLHASWSVIGGLRAALAELRRQGKRVVINLMVGGEEKMLYLASAADEVALSPAASLTLAGLSSQSLYLRDLLARIGIRLEVNAQGNYKTAAETLTRSEMSPAQREQTEALLGGRHALLSRALEARLAEGESVESLVHEVSLSPARAQAAGLVQHLCYEDGLQACLKQTELGASWCMEAASYRKMRVRSWWKPLRARPCLTVLPLVGAIREGAAARNAVTLEPTVAAIRALRRDKRVAGVLLYVNSPGGSAMISDLIHHEIEQLAAEKPVVAYFADVAASGGYYIAAPAQRIVAAPEAITGSIGVVSAKLVASDLLQRFGVNAQVVRTAPHADMLSVSRSMDEVEQAIVERESQRIYRRFLDVVAAGRHMTLEAVEAVAAGRVWSAEAALAHGLVDQLGTLSDAIAALTSLASPPPAPPLRVQVYAPRARQKAWAFVAPPPEKQQQWAGLWAELEGYAWLVEAAERPLCYWPSGQRDCSS